MPLPCLLRAPLARGAKRRLCFGEGNVERPGRGRTDFPVQYDLSGRVDVVVKGSRTQADPFFGGRRPASVARGAFFGGVIPWQDFN